MPEMIDCFANKDGRCIALNRTYCLEGEPCAGDRCPKWRASYTNPEVRRCGHWRNEKKTSQAKCYKPCPFYKSAEKERNELIRIDGTDNMHSIAKSYWLEHGGKKDDE